MWRRHWSSAFSFLLQTFSFHFILFFSYFSSRSTGQPKTITHAKLCKVVIVWKSLPKKKRNAHPDRVSFVQAVQLFRQSPEKKTKERKKRKRRYLFHFGAFWLFYYCATSQIDVATTTTTSYYCPLYNAWPCVCVYMLRSSLKKRRQRHGHIPPPSLLVIYLCIYFCFLYIPIQLAMRTGRRSRWCVQRRPKRGWEGGKGPPKKKELRKGMGSDVIHFQSAPECKHQDKTRTKNQELQIIKKF